MSSEPLRAIFRATAFLDFILDELEEIQSFRAVCRSAASDYTTDCMCWAAFHETDIIFDPSFTGRPLWMRCYRGESASR